MLHPLFWVGLVALLLNDHVLKHAGVLPPLVTGKLSDFAGLWVAPAVLAALCGVRSRSAWAACHAAVGVGFASINVWPDAALTVAQTATALGVPSRIWCDPTDLVALPALWVGHRVLGAAAAGSVDLRVLWRASLSRGGLALGLFGCIATSRMPPPRVAADAERAYVPLVDEDQVAVVDAASGRELQRFRYALRSFPRPVVVDGVLVGFGEIEGASHLMGIDVTSGELRFAKRETASGSALPLLDASPLVITLRQPEKEGISHELAAHEAKTGALRWTRIIPDAIDLTLHVRGDVALVGRSGAVERLDPSTGERRWELELTEDIVSMTSLGGRVFIQLDNEAILGVDDASGRVVVRRQIEARTVKGWTTTTGSLAASDRALFLLADGGPSTPPPTVPPPRPRRRAPSLRRARP